MPSPSAQNLPLVFDEVNGMNEEEFVAHFGPIFEHSEWIARETWQQRPFASRNELLAKLVGTLRRAPREKQIELICAHPDLAGRLAKGRLTAESSREQASAGLDHLSADELGQFESCNRRYREKFGFPFVICARLNDKRAILLAFQRRLLLSREEEIETALEEIEKIAALRLTPLLRP
jgi:2-oxo-4-hydroxy-4-carboxy-5-ureidoimidazoline decarboxylase